MDNYYKALEIFKKNKNVHYQASVYKHLANIFTEENDYTASKKYYHKALAIYEQYKNTYSQAGIYMNLGIICSKEKKYVLSKSYYDKALAIFKQCKDVQRQAVVYQNLGNIHKKSNEELSEETQLKMEDDIRADFSNTEKNKKLIRN